MSSIKETIKEVVHETAKAGNSGHVGKGPTRNPAVALEPVAASLVTKGATEDGAPDGHRHDEQPEGAKKLS